MKFESHYTLYMTKCIRLLKAIMQASAMLANYLKAVPYFGYELTIAS